MIETNDRSGIRIRAARPADATAISRLNNEFADEQLMLRRTPEMVELAIDDYVVAVTEADTIVGCGALKEYSPSLAEVAAIAVARSVHGRGLGREIVRAVETLARKRDIHDVFALTLQPQFFEAIGYVRVDRARYPEKIRRDCLGCSRRFACNETCFARNLQPAERGASRASDRDVDAAGAGATSALSVTVERAPRVTRAA